MIYINKSQKNISPNIPLNAVEIAQAIQTHQRSPWNSNIGNNYDGVEILTDLWKYMNSGIPEEPYFYKGNLYRIHSPKTKNANDVDTTKEFIVGKICDEDNSCSVLPITHYDSYPISFSKIYDFTNNNFYKVLNHRPAIFNYINTQDKYGIDVNWITKKYGGYDERVVGEQEIMFPLLKEYVVKEYKCSPNQFLYYMRNKK